MNSCRGRTRGHTRFFAPKYMRKRVPSVTAIIRNFSFSVEWYQNLAFEIHPACKQEQCCFYSLRNSKQSTSEAVSTGIASITLWGARVGKERLNLRP